MILKMVKIYLGLSLVLLWAVWGQFIFGQFLGPAYISQDLQAPSYVVGTNYRVLIYCTCHFQGGSLCFSFFCLLVSSVSNFRPDTRGQWWSHFQAHLFNSAVGREEHCKQILLVCVGSACSVSAKLDLSHSQRVYFHGLYFSGSRLLCQELSEAGPGLPALPRSKSLRFTFLCTLQMCRLSWACVLCPSQVRAAQVTRCLASGVAATYHLPCPCHSVFWVYNWRTFSGVPCVSSMELISGCDPPSGCQPSRIPRSLGQQ